MDKQRKAVKEATRRYRANKQGITPKVSQGITRVGITQDILLTPVIPDSVKLGIARHEIMTSGAMVVPDKLGPNKPKPQSHSPMMVGYVPPEPDA